MLGSIKILYRAVVILMVTLLAAGCSKNQLKPSEEILSNTRDMREAASIYIEDASRRDRVLALIGEMESAILKFDAEAASFVREYERLDRDYSSSRESYEMLLEEFSGQRETAQQKIIGLHFEIVALVSADEWKKIVKYEERAIKAATAARSAESGVVQ